MKKIINLYSLFFKKSQFKNIELVMKNTLWLFFEKVFNLILSLITSVFILRYLGPQNYGIFSYALAYISIFSSLPVFGLDKIIIKDLSIFLSKSSEIMNTTFSIQVLSSIVAFILAVSIILIFNIEFHILVYILILSISFIFKPLYISSYYFDSRLESKYVSKMLAFLKFVYSICVFLSILFKLDLVFFVIIHSLFLISNNVFVFLLGLKYHQIKFKFNYNTNMIKKYFKLGLPLFISSFGSIIFLRIDQLFVGEILGSYSLGVFSAAVRVSELWYFIPISIASSILPYISKITDFQKYFKIISKYSSLLTYIALFAAIIVTIFSKLIISILFGNEYFEAYKVLNIYMWSGVFISLGIVRNTYLVSNDLVYYDMIFNILGAIFNIILNIFLIPIYGLIGAAIGTLISYSFYGFILTFLFKELRFFGIIQLKAIFFIR